MVVAEQKKLSIGKCSRVFTDNLEAFRTVGKKRALNQGGTSSTKCLGRGTKIVMHDMTLKCVEDIRVGDKLMGVDGTPRIVLKLYSGLDDLYKIKQARGIDYVVSSNHILSLRENWKEVRKSVTLPRAEGEPYKQKRVYIGHTNSHELVNISLQDYLQKSGKWKRRHKGWKAPCVELKYRKVDIEPYFVGLWLGDGTTGDTAVTNSDHEVIDYLKWFALRNDLKYSKAKSDPYGHTLTKTSGKTNPLRGRLRKYGILEDKHIPHEYLNNSREIRLGVLAGLIDSDGFNTGKNSVGITITNKKLAEDIVLLTRSLGFYTTFNSYTAKMKRKDGSIYQTPCYRIEFTGDGIGDVPCLLERKRIKNKPLPRRLVSSFDVEPMGQGEYFGFEITGDHLFLLEDFTVTHNTWSIMQLLIVICEYAKENIRVTVASESLPHLKRGCIDTFKKIMGEAFIDSCWNRSDFIYDFGKAILEFVPCDSPGKFAGPRRDILFINECNAIPYELFSQADMRTSKFVFLDWNPTSEFWVHEYGMIDADDNTFIHSTYKDATEIGVLDSDIVEKIEAYKTTDPNLWKVYGLGQLGESDGLVFPDYEIIYDNEFPKEGTIGYGLDFGWTDVTALGKFCIKDNGLYGHQLIYDKNLNADQIDARLTELGLAKHGLPIWADSNNPGAVDYLKKAGWNVLPVVKGKDSVQMGIDACKRYKHYWTESSLDSIKEQRNYRFVKKYDKIANKYIQTNDTTHQWSHMMDARRYYAHMTKTGLSTRRYRVF